DPSKIQATSNAITTASSVIDNNPQILQFVSSTVGSEGSTSDTATILSAKHATIITSANSSPIMSSGQKQATAVGTENLPEGAKTSRQNLNTIVEAIRHLEGDHLFN